MVDNRKEGDPPISSDAIINALNNLLGNNKTNFVNRVVATNTVRDHVLQRRKDIPDPIYQLLNEVKSPLFNFHQTITQMASTLEAKKYQRNMVNMFLNTKVLMKGVQVKGGKDIVSPNVKLNERIVVDGEVYFTDKFTKAQILGYEKYGNVFARTYMKFLAAVKMGKTVYSPATHARNFTSNFGFAVMNGHVNPGYMYESMFLAGQIFNQSSVEERRVLFRKMVELGVIDDVADLSELRDMLRAGGSEAFGSTDLEPGDVDEKTILEKVGRVPKKTLKNIHKGVLNMYLFEDAYWKTVGFLHEMNRYQNAGLSREDAMNEAGNIVRNAYPTYSMTPELVKKLRINPLVGTFVSYPAEVIRTQIMTIKQAKKEINSSNNKIREIGVKRMVGIAAWHIGFPVAATALFKGLALGLGMIAKGLSDEEEEQLSFFDSELMQNKEVAELIRFVGADWNKNSQIIPMMETEPGVYYFWSVSDNNSHGYFTEIVNSIFERQEDDPFWGDDDWAILVNDPTVIAILEPFLGEDILAKNIREITMGQKDNGAPLYEKQDTKQEKFEKAMAHLWDGVKPSIINNAERLIKSYQPTEEDGSKYVPEFEWLALGGIRLSKIDLAESYKYKMMAINNYINDFTVKKEDGTYEFKTKDAKEKIIRMLEFADNYSEAIHDLGIERMTVMDEEKGMPDSNYGGNPEKSNYIKYIILKNIYARPGLREIILRDKGEVYGFPDVEEVLEWALKDKQVEALKNQVEQD